MKFPFWPDPKGYRNIDFGLTRVFELLERLNNPHLKLPITIHIAGTNGKGSTLSFLKKIFEEANLKVHSYISPHLVDFNERITIANQEISDDFLNECLAECKNAAEAEPKIEATFFEGITVAAFLAFSKVKADILLLETGMGGRLDATNVLPRVLASIITPISFDHTDFLGKTLSKIAFEKAGIIKKNCPVFIARQKISALKILVQEAKKNNSERFIFNQNWQIKKYKNHFIYRGFNKNLHLPLPSLEGDHQVENASLAISVALNQKFFKVSEENIKSALKKTFWAARLQKINDGKLYKILPKNCQLYLDGSHNPQGGETISKFLRKQNNKKIFVIFSMLQDKDCQGFLKKFSDKVDFLFITKIEDEAKSQDPKKIFQIAKKLKIKCEIAENIESVLKKITKIADDKKCEEEFLILICGSLYQAGNFLEKNKL
jgi:dihydrofolate synthase/folylpolyglutamate synthase